MAQSFADATPGGASDAASAGNPLEHRPRLFPAELIPESYTAFRVGGPRPTGRAAAPAPAGTLLFFRGALGGRGKHARAALGAGVRPAELPVRALDRRASRGPERLGRKGHGTTYQGRRGFAGVPFIYGQSASQSRTIRSGAGRFPGRGERESEVDLRPFQPRPGLFEEAGLRTRARRISERCRRGTRSGLQLRRTRRCLYPDATIPRRGKVLPRGAAPRSAPAELLRRARQGLPAHAKLPESFERHRFRRQARSSPYRHSLPQRTDSAPDGAQARSQERTGNLGPHRQRSPGPAPETSGKRYRAVTRTS